LQAFCKVLKAVPTEGIHEVFEDIISIEERMHQLKELVIAKEKISFFQIFEGNRTKQQVVVTFMAILEIVKQKIAKILQEKAHGDIFIERVRGQNEIEIQG